MITPNPDTESYELYLEMLEADLDDNLDAGLRYAHAMALIRSGFWVQRNGELIRFKDMTGSHIRNTIAMIDRNMDGYDPLTAECVKAWRAALSRELKNRYAPVDLAFAEG